MDLSYGEAAEAFRGEVRAFLASHWPPTNELRGTELKNFIREFRRQATEQGYLYRAIPKRYGGSEQPVDVIRAQVIREEFQRARAPMEVGGNGMNMTVPTLLEKGTEEQRELFVRKTLEGDYIWGQGYSEPGAGSDLASVRTKGELSPDGTKWIINGQKIWTSQGMQATHMFMLVRTEPDAPKHDGITYLLIDLDQPGVTRRPIRQMTGEEGDHTFCEFFFDNAETPVAWQVGDRGQGWSGVAGCGSGRGREAGGANSAAHGPERIDRHRPADDEQQGRTHRRRRADRQISAAPLRTHRRQRLWLCPDHPAHSG